MQDSVGLLEVRDHQCRQAICYVEPDYKPDRLCFPDDCGPYIVDVRLGRITELHLVDGELRERHRRVIDGYMAYWIGHRPYDNIECIFNVEDSRAFGVDLLAGREDSGRADESIRAPTRVSQAKEMAVDEVAYLGWQVEEAERPVRVQVDELLNKTELFE